MTKMVKEYDFQKEDEEKLVDMLYKTTLREYPGIPIPDEELAKELLRVGIQAKYGVMEGTILKYYLPKYNDEEIVKIWQEKMPLVTAAEFKTVHRDMLEQTSELEKKLATAVAALKRITEIPDHEEYFDCEECISMMEEAAKQALAEIGGEVEK